MVCTTLGLMLQSCTWSIGSAASYTVPFSCSSYLRAPSSRPNATELIISAATSKQKVLAGSYQWCVPIWQRPNCTSHPNQQPVALKSVDYSVWLVECNLLSEICWVWSVEYDLLYRGWSIECHLLSVYMWSNGCGLSNVISQWTRELQH